MAFRDLNVGVLAIQGDVEAHIAALQRLGATGRAVRKERDLAGLAALILPGGESTTISKGLAREGLANPIQEFVSAGNPVLGTCAGAILLSREAENHPVPTLGLLDVVALRNAYGTQVDSFAQVVDAGAAEGFEGLRCVFIRAPQLSELGAEVEVLARVEGLPVLVRQGNVLATTFHPELTEDSTVHAALLAQVSGPDS